MFPLLIVVASAGCGGGDNDAVAVSESVSEIQYPDVVAVEVTASGSGLRFDVTISSPYDSPDRYADAWRVIGTDGTVYGVRELLHDHATEQPFTRSLDGVEIPAGVETVTVEGRDLVNGWGGATIEVAVPN